MGKKDHLQAQRKNAHLWTIFDRLYYFKENNYRGYLLLLFIIMNLLLFTVSVVIISLLPGNKGMGLKEIIWKSFSLILDQGNLQPDPSPMVTFILAIIAILGMIFLSGGMVAFLSSMLQDYLEEIRDGDQMIHYKHFTLFLGFNARSVALLKSFMRNELQRNETDFIVILSKMDSRKLRESIMKELKEFHRNTEGTHELRILVRSGNPAEYGSLLMVNYKDADKLFIFNEDASPNTDFSVERTFFSLMRAWIPDNVNRETAPNAETKCDREIIVETSLKETAELIRRFQADNSGFCIKVFSIDQILAQKYADMISDAVHAGENDSYDGKDAYNRKILICNINSSTKNMLKILAGQSGGIDKKDEGLTLIVEKDQESEAEELYGDPELSELWEDEPVVAQTESELKTRLIEEINKGSATLFVFSDRSDTFDYGERYNFELWISLITEVERQQIQKNRIFFEMDDKTDARIIEGFEIGECVIRDKIINEYYMENLLHDA